MLCRPAQVLRVMVLLLAAGSGCVRRSGTTAATVGERLQVVRRTWSAADTTLAARSQGQLAVAVRSADLPMQALAQARVQLAVDGDSRVFASVSADSVGHARFDTLHVGRYRVTVSRLGYRRAAFTVPVERGCRTHLEVYIAMEFMGIAPPPPTPARATATLCPSIEVHRP